MNKKTIITVLVITIILLGIIFVISRFSNNQSNQQSPVVLFDQSPFPSPTIRPGGGLEGPEYQNREKEFLQKTPILQKLPFNTPYFEIEYLSEQQLIVHAKTQDKNRDFQVAQSWFKENDIDTSKIQIEYK